MRGITNAEGVGMHLKLLLISKRVVHVKVDRQCFAKVVISDREATAERCFTVIRRPRQGKPGLKVVLIPAIKRLAAIRRPRLINGYRHKIVLTLFSSRDAIS